MVLNKSKWDHKAKIQYLKKHNLTKPRPKQEINTPKWSAKKSQDISGNSWLDESEDSDWDSEDEAVLNHFYPQISEDNLSVENKRKLKRQIIKIVKQRETADVQEHTGTYPDEEDGIYLGQKPAQNDTAGDGPENEEYEYSDGEVELEIPDLDTKLSEFMVSDLGKSRNRKLLKNKFSENLLDEYGLESYSSTVKDTDYNSTVKEQFRNIDKLTAADLHGLRIGEDIKAKNEKRENNVRALSEAELEEHRARAEKLEHVKFHDKIKKKFGSDPGKGKVLEINNFNVNDKDQLASLNAKLTSNSGSGRGFSGVDDDLDELLGLKNEKTDDGVEQESSDFLSETLPRASISRKDPGKKEARKSKPSSDTFLDDLLGI